VFNEIFARPPSHRGRALMAFYVSTGARASELLSATQGGVDSGAAADRRDPQGEPRVAGTAVSTDAFVAETLPGADGRTGPARAST
jgi:hypothetical protein